MSQMSELYQEIKELVLQGYDAETISKRLNVPTEWVHSVEDDHEKEFAN